MEASLGCPRETFASTLLLPAQSPGIQRVVSARRLGPESSVSPVVEIQIRDQYLSSRGADLGAELGTVTVKPAVVIRANLIRRAVCTDKARSIRPRCRPLVRRT